MKIFSLDQATKTCGYSIFIDEKLIEYGKIKSAKNEKNPIERITQMFMQLQEKIQQTKPDYIVFENTMFQTNIEVLKQLCWLQGCIIGICANENLGFRMYLPSEWRKLLSFPLKQRDEQKQKAVEYVNETYGLNLVYDKNGEKTDDDIAEAICIGTALLKQITII